MTKQGMTVKPTDRSILCKPTATRGPGLPLARVDVTLTELMVSGSLAAQEQELDSKIDAPATLPTDTKGNLTHLPFPLSPISLTLNRPQIPHLVISLAILGLIPRISRSPADRI